MAPGQHPASILGLFPLLLVVESRMSLRPQVGDITGCSPCLFSPEFLCRCKGWRWAQAQEPERSEEGTSGAEAPRAVLSRVWPGLGVSRHGGGAGRDQLVKRLQLAIWKQLTGSPLPYYAPPPPPHSTRLCSVWEGKTEAQPRPERLQWTPSACPGCMHSGSLHVRRGGQGSI